MKVYTALNQCVGAVGETSTEFKSVIDLHPDAQVSEDKSVVLDLSEAVLDESTKVSDFIFDTETKFFDFNDLFRFHIRQRIGVGVLSLGTVLFAVNSNPI